MFVVIVSHYWFGAWSRPLFGVALLHVIAFGFDLAAFIVALTSHPYMGGCANSDSKGCVMLRAAIGLDGVLW